MTKREYLMEYSRAAAEMEDALRDLEAARTRAEGLRAIIYSDMPKTRDTERDLSAALVELEEHAEKALKTIRRCGAIMDRVERSIATVKDARMYRVLRLYYIDGLTYEAIAERMNRSRQWVWHLHKEGLRRVRLKWERG